MSEGWRGAVLLVRHLVMPENLAGTAELASWLAREISPHTWVNLMDQYHPAGKVVDPVGRRLYPELTRRITREEWSRAQGDAEKAGLYRFDARG